MVKLTQLRLFIIDCVSVERLSVACHFRLRVVRDGFHITNVGYRLYTTSVSPSVRPSTRHIQSASIWMRVIGFTTPVSCQFLRGSLSTNTSFVFLTRAATGVRNNTSRSIPVAAVVDKFDPPDSSRVCHVNFGQRVVFPLIQTPCILQSISDNHVSSV